MISASRLMTWLFAIMVAPLSLGAQADQYPARPVRLIVPFPAGTSIDAASRILARQMAAEIGVPVVVENKPGAGGTVGAVAAARAEPNGYTIFLGSVATLIGKLAQPSAAFDPVKDFSPVSLVYKSAGILTVSSDSTVKSAADLVEWAQRHPGALNYYSGGVGTAAHLLGATFARKERIEAVHVPVRTVTDMLPQLTDEVPHFAFFTGAAVRPYIESNRLRPLAVSTRVRMPQLPDVPTLLELFKDADMVHESWLGIWAPANTPTPMVRKLFTAVVKAVNTADFRNAMLQQGQQAVASGSPEEFGKYIGSEYEQLKRVTGAVQISSSH